MANRNNPPAGDSRWSWLQKLDALWSGELPDGEPRFSWRRCLCYTRRLTEGYSTHQCGLMACACAYCALLSLVPLLVIGIAVLGFVLGGNEKSLHEVQIAIRSYAPHNVDFLNTINEILARILRDRRLIGIAGLTGWLWAAHQAFLSMQPAMNIIWGVAETRHWLRQRVVAVCAALYTILLLGLNLAAVGAVAYLQRYNLPFFSGNVEGLLLQVGLHMVPMLLMILLFALLYQYLPSREVPWKAAFLGATVAALSWQISLYAFSLYLSHFNSYDRLYGPLGGLVILVVWAYYSMAILLFGAEIAADYTTMQRGNVAAEARVHSGADLAAATGKEPSHSDTNLSD